MERLRRLATAADPYCLLIPLAVYSVLVFAGDFHPDADSYYHMGVSRLYASEGWVSSFPWMQYTVLAESFPNVHFLQHVALLPLAALFEPVSALKFALVLLPFALVLSVFLVLRRWGVPFAGIWVALIAVSSPVFLTLAVSIKGGALFAILLVWILDALRARARRRAFILAWLAAYAYTGASILIGIVLIDAVVRRIWDGRWELATGLWLLGGLVAGLVINPFWPDHWEHIWAELFSTVSTPEELVPGDFRGTEWMSLRGEDLMRLAGVPIVAWGLLLLRQLGRDARLAAPDAFGAVLGICFVGASLLMAKFLYQLLQMTLLFLPLVAFAMRPWPRWVPAVAIAAGIAIGVGSIGIAHRDLYSTEAPEARRSRAPGPNEYRALAEWLPSQTEPNELVLAPWDDFPGLFYFNTENRYAVGMNPDFMRRYDTRTFNAYYMLYHGRVSDPEQLLPMFFGDARLIVVRRTPRNEGERALNQRLEANPHFTELAPPAETLFRVFRAIRG